MKQPSDWRDAWVVFLKEMRETLRDTRTLIIMVVVPVVLYPAIMIASEQLALFGRRQLERDPSPIAVTGDADTLLVQFLQGRENLELVEVEDPEAAVRADDVAAVAQVRLPSGDDQNRTVSLFFDAADDQSRRGRQMLLDALEDWGDSLLSERVAEEGLAEGFARPLVVEDSNIARPEELGGYALGRFLPMLLVVMTLLGAFYPAIDLAAGEKERGTLETLLTAPVPAGQVVAGKFLAVTVIGLMAAGLNLGSMLLTFQTGLFQLTQAFQMEFSLPLSSILIIFATLFPLAVLFGALFLGIAVRSRSFKEAQNALTPVYMLFIFPALLPLFPGIEFSDWLALIPVAGVSLLFRELMSGGADPLRGLLAILSTVGYAALALLFAARSFGREEVLFGSGKDSGEPGAGRGLLGFFGRKPVLRDYPDPAPTGVFIAVMGVLFFYGMIRLQVAYGEVGMLASEIGLILIPSLLFLRLGGYRAKTTLSLRNPGLRGFLAGTLIILGAIPLVWFVTWLQGFVLPLPTEFMEGMTDFLLADSPGRVLWLLVIVALGPAVSEEVLFRGIFLAGTRRGLGTAATIILNGVVFGLFHVPAATVFRFLPSAILGMLLTWVVIRTRSIWTGMLMHLLNNGSIVLLVASPWILERFASPETGPPVWILFPAAGSLLLGGYILETGEWGGEGSDSS